jgi:hypothetical protein
MIDRTKALLAGGLVTGALAFGALGTAMAQDESPTPTPTPTPEQQAPQERGDRQDRPGHDCPEEEQGSGSGSSSDAGFSGDAVPY